MVDFQQWRQIITDPGKLERNVHALASLVTFFFVFVFSVFFGGCLIILNILV